MLFLRMSSLKGWALLSHPPAWPEEEASCTLSTPLLRQVSSGVGKLRLAGQGHVGMANESMLPEGTGPL